MAEPGGSIGPHLSLGYCTLESPVPCVTVTSRLQVIQSQAGEIMIIIV